ncbi:MAG: glutamine synthetase family protein [Pseudomonadota bacterium]
MTARQDLSLKEQADAFVKQHPHLDQLELLASDLNGNFFSKRFPYHQLPQLVENGLSVPRAMYVLSGTSESMADYVGMGEDDGDPDMLVDIAPGTLSITDWGEIARAQAVLHSRPSEVIVDPRRVLADVIDQCKKKGLNPVVAFELEYTYFEKDRAENGALKTVINPLTNEADTPTMLGAERLEGFESILNETIASCKAQGIGTSTVCAEYGAGQFEINFPHYENALEAADHAQLFRRAVKSVARKNNKRASFIAKYDPECAGNGQHMHVSMLNEKGENIFSGGDKPADALMHAIGGLKQASREAMLFWAPSLNSYRRFAPSNCTPTGATWAFEHRHVAFRIPLAKGNAWRVENRVPGADANCYLTMATMLAGMLYGIENQIDPGEETSGAPGMDSSLLPLSIRDAIKNTREGQILPNYIDEDFIALFANHREGELHSFEDFISPRELDWYL